jgi:hypothetical protein
MRSSEIGCGQTWQKCLGGSAISPLSTSPRVTSLLPLSRLDISPCDRLPRISKWLFPDSRELCDQEVDHRPQSRLASSSDVVHAREAAHVDRPLLLGEATVRTAPRPAHGPAACPRVDRPLTAPLAIVVAGQLARGVTDGLRGVTPRGQPGVESIRSGVPSRPWGDRAAPPRRAGRLRDLRPPPDDDLARALAPAPERRRLLRPRPSPPFPLPPAAAGGPTVFVTAAGGPVGPAPTATSSPATSPVRVTSGGCGTRPSRRGEALIWTAVGGTSSAWALGAFDRCSALQERQSIQTRHGG